MAKPTAAQCHTLITYYSNQYSGKYGKNAVFNRPAAKVGVEGLLMDYSMDDAKSMIDFYLGTPATSQNKNHSLTWFLYNYDKIVMAIEAHREDAERRKKLREESEQRAKEWRESGKSGITGN